MNAAGSVYDTATSPPLVSQGATGAISGGILRPGSIDQGAFLQQLEQAQQNREAAGVGGKPVSMPIQSFQSNIPTLSSAQFAALVGAQADNPSLADPEGGAAADPQAAAQSVPQVIAPAAAAPAAFVPAATALKLSGKPTPPPAQTGTGATADAAEEDAPTIVRVGSPTLIASADASATDSSAKASPDGKSTDASKTPTPPPDPNVVHLKDAPDRETQRNLMAAHKRWVVDETPGARQLFFGADGVFGWDDFLDVINPLQHIPIIAQIYRAATGDQINGAAELIGSLPFGPLGMIGTMATIADLAVKDTTGKDIGGNLEAMLFGTGSDKKGTGDPADGTSDMAQATPVHPNLDMQSASAESGTDNLEAARQAHDQRRG